MISAVLDEPELGTVLSSFVLDDDLRQDVKDKLQLFLQKLTESARLVVIKWNPSELLWKSIISLILVIY